MTLFALRKKANQIWESSWFFSEHLEKRLLERSLQEALLYASGDMLDLGCGHKPYAALFQGRIRRHIGIDYPLTVDQHMSSGYSAPQVDIYAAGEAIPLCDGSVHTVLCTQVLEHTPEPSDMLGEISRVLEPGGHLILTAPQEWGLHQEPHDYYRYTKYGLRYLAAKNGLDVIYVKPRGGLWAVLGQRWSSYLYDTYSRPLRRRGKRIAFALSLLITLPACAFSQLLGAGLDRVQPLAANTLGYIMVAIKPVKGAQA